MLIATILIILVLNIAYGVRKVFDDLANGQRAMAALGAACLIGMNAIIVWLVYASIMTSTDL